MSFRFQPALALFFGFAIGVSPSFVAAETPITLALSSFDKEGVEAFQIDGEAAIVGGELRLTKDQAFQWGAALNTIFTNLGPDASFSSYFSFAIKKSPVNNAGGADGFAFLVQTNLTSKRGEGRTIGYAGAGPSLAIEFDTYKNGDSDDPDQNHIGINLNGKTKSIATASPPFILNDGSTYHVWVDYDGTKSALEVRIAESDKRPADATLTHTINLADLFSGAVYVGFSAATGAGHEQHDIKSLYFHRELVEGGINVAKEEYVTAKDS